MFGSYMLGFFGGFVIFSGVSLLLVACVSGATGGNDAGLYGFVGVAACVGGGFMRYLSRQSVRTFPASQTDNKKVEP